MLSEEVKRYEALTGESSVGVPISRLGGYLDGYEKGVADADILTAIKTECEKHKYFCKKCKLYIGEVGFEECVLRPAPEDWDIEEIRKRLNDGTQD